MVTATDELRAELTRRRVEYVGTHPSFTGWWGNYDLYWSAMEVYEGELDLGTNMSNVSPEQAISVTLGPADPRERGLIPHFWTGDGALHIKPKKLPERIDVTLPDQRGREVHSAKVHRFVPERTCRYELKDGWLACSNCGRSMRAFEDPLDPPNFCPRCGARVEVDA